MKIWNGEDWWNVDNVEQMIEAMEYVNEKGRKFIDISRMRALIRHHPETQNLVGETIAYCKKNFYECQAGKWHVGMKGE